MSRFGTFSLENIDTSSKNIKPLNTVRSETYIWRQFMEFCDVRKYTLVEGHTEEDLANILQDWAYNMRKKNGTEYKEAVVKTIWNVSAKLLEKYYFEEHHAKIIASLRKNEAAPSMPSTSNSSSTCTNSSVNTTEKNCTAVYNHCTFNFYK